MQCISLRFFPIWCFPPFLVNQRGQTNDFNSNLLESSSPYIFYQSGSLGHVWNGSDGSWVTNKWPMVHSGTQVRHFHRTSIAQAYLVRQVDFSHRTSFFLYFIRYSVESITNWNYGDWLWRYCVIITLQFFQIHSISHN